MVPVAEDGLDTSPTVWLVTEHEVVPVGQGVGGGVWAMAFTPQASAAQDVSAPKTATLRQSAFAAR